ncbi:MAG: sugar transferase [Planctomycetes bacterium]|nr:sugar transferase [Planctomycetota bacterium]
MRDLVKRTFDLIVGGLLLIAALPAMALIAVAIRAESRGGPLFRQRRAGRHGKPFTMLKFRTMRCDADPYGRSPESGDDPRLTRVGKFLREHSLDELPQVLNVLAGTMSLVGPRPLYERQAAQWTDRQRRRLEVRPGITGWAQVHGRGEIPIEEKIELDLWYVDHRSLRLDVKILWATLTGSFRGGRGVYEKKYSHDQQRERY